MCIFLMCFRRGGTGSENRLLGNIFWDVWIVMTRFFRMIAGNLHLFMFQQFSDLVVGHLSCLVDGLLAAAVETRRCLVLDLGCVYATVAGASRMSRPCELVLVGRVDVCG